MPKIGKIAGLCACLLLSGCFMSAKPLITARTADLPFADGSHFVEETNCAGPAQIVCGTDKGYHKTASSGTMHIEHGHYVMKSDPGSSFAAAAGAGGGNADPAVMLKGVGGGLYIVQMDMGADPRSRMPDTGRYLYELLDVKGKDAYVYSFTCEQNGDQHYVKAGELASVTSAMGMPICNARDLSGLAAVFRERVAGGEQPSERMVFN